MWAAETTPLREQRYRALLQSALPPETGQHDSNTQQWLHAAATSPSWAAVAALGPVPDDPAARLAWQQEAAAIGTYCELSGHDHPDEVPATSGRW